MFGMLSVRLGHVIVDGYRDHGISGGKGREKRPAFDKLHRDATLRKFDLVMAWSVDRLGQSLQDLVHFLDHLASSLEPPSRKSAETAARGEIPKRRAF